MILGADLQKVIETCIAENVPKQEKPEAKMPSISKVAALRVLSAC